MSSSFSFYKWFQKVISIFIDIFFVSAIIATLFVFTSVFSGAIKYIFFILIAIIYGLVIYFLKDKIKGLIESILARVSKLDVKTMLIVITLVMIILKVIFTVLFSFDATQDGDIKIYNEIANGIVSSGALESNAISHLFGVAIHLALFKFLNIPLNVGMFIPFYIGTIINFFSFKEIIGKEKSFLLILIYNLMPSSVLLSFCPTHELFVYLYLSFTIFIINRLIKENNSIISVILSICLSVGTILTCMVNPVGYIIYVIDILIIVLSNTKKMTKILLAVSIVLSVFGTNVIDRKLNVNEYITSLNTYTILIHGSNPESLGEQVDGYPKAKMREYLVDNDIEITADSFLVGAKHVLINQYVNFLTNPLLLLRLVCHKIYILWSGNHYSIELAHYYHAFNDIVFYALLVISTLIYLFMLTIGIVYYKRRENTDIEVSNYQLAILGVFAVTMLSVVLNKYSVYVTLFIYLLSMYRMENDGKVD